MNSGLVYIFTGEGKGKTSAALGVATRSLLLDKQVAWVAFYKQESWGLAEAKLASKFPKLEMYFGGKGFSLGKSDSQQVSVSARSVGQLASKTSKSVKMAPVGKMGHVVLDTASEEEHLQAAQACLKQASQQLKQQPFLLVMDEVLNAVTEGLLTEQEVMKLLENRGDTHVVLTGRHDPSSQMWQVLLQASDLVTECVKVKHPYDTGKLAVSGLDY